MSARKRTEITIETSEFVFIRRTRLFRAWCPECGRNVEMVNLTQAEALSRKTHPATPQPVLPGITDSRGWHWHRGDDGVARVCLQSLLNSR